MNHSEKDNELLGNIHRHLPELAKLLEEMSSHWLYEDPVYRFYHQSFKVYGVQGETVRMVEGLKKIAPDGAEFCRMFEEIFEAGTSGKPFEAVHNARWTEHTRPMIEAFFHARFFLEMAVKYGKELQAAPAMLPSGWAALLCLYDLR